MGGLQVLQLKEGIRLEEALKSLRDSGLVEFAEPDYLVQAAVVTPNDPRYLDGTLWNQNNTGQSGGTADADVDAPEAWEIATSASNIIVAVIDSGIRPTHEDLQANLWVNTKEIPGNGLDDDGNGVADDVNGINAIDSPRSGNVLDDHGHGTHVAGIIGAVGNNGLGVAGIAWRVQILTGKFLDSTGNGYISDAVECFDYARARGAKIINASFGSTSYSSALYQAVSACRSAGIIVVCAAGNDGNNNDSIGYYPANFGYNSIYYSALDNVVSVAATDRNDQLAYFSNYGSNNVHLAAPGYTIYSTYFTGDSAYTYLSGTSMAAPHVAGLLALMRVRFPIESHQQLIARALEGADRLPNLAGKCRTGARLNCYNALANYQILSTNYNWITPANATAFSLGDNGVSTAVDLPFVFNFYGRNYSQLFIGANGLIGFTNQGLGSGANVDLGATNAPLAVVCPLWDDLNPGSGAITYGTNGVAPQRQAVITWTNVPRNSATQTKLTFQAVFAESSQQILFQYLEVQPNRTTTGGGGRSATVGLRNHDGSKTARFLYNGSPFTLTNRQAMVFVPLAAEVMEVSPPAGLSASGVTGGPFSPDSLAYTLANSGNTVLNWTATNTQPWLSLSAAGGLLPVGQGVAVTVSLNTNAQLLPPGNHFDTVLFYNNGNTNPTAVRQVNLTVIGTNAALAVTPESGISSSGFTGGPFAPASQLFTLLNVGDATMNWAIRKSQPWLTLSATNGNLAPGGSVVVGALFNSAAGALPAGDYTDTLEFLNLTTGKGDTTRPVSLSVIERPGILAVAPVHGFLSAGVTGGPFDPESLIYTLTNSGTGPLTWQAVVSQAWIELSATNGFLSPGQTTNVVVRLSASAAALTPETYYGKVDFLNLSTGVGNASRAVTLQVFPPPGLLQVAPATNALSLTGLVGGPFSLSNLTFTVTNAGGSNLHWAVLVGDDWLTAVPADGELAAGAGADVVLQFSDASTSLPEGAFTNLVKFVNLDTGQTALDCEVVLRLDHQAALELAHEPTTEFAGVSGGPFTPASVTCLLSNRGVGQMTWRVATTNAWLDINPPQGVLGPAQAVEVILTPGGEAGHLAPGVYESQVDFINESTGQGDTHRFFSLRVYPLPGELLVLGETNRVNFTGYVGGPILSTNLALFLTNAGGSNLQWTAASDDAWLGVSVQEGQLAAGAATNLVVFLEAGAAPFSAGVYSNRLVVSQAGAGARFELLAKLQMLSRPVLAASLAAMNEGQFQFSLAGEPGKDYVLQWSSNLVDWTAWTTNQTDAQGLIQVVDQANAPQKYYRVMVVP